MLAISNQLAELLGMLIGGVATIALLWFALRRKNQGKAIGGPILLLAILVVLIVGTLIIAGRFM